MFLKGVEEVNKDKLEKIFNKFKELWEKYDDFLDFTNEMNDYLFEEDVKNYHWEADYWMRPILIIENKFVIQFNPETDELELIIKAP